MLAAHIVMVSADATGGGSNVLLPKPVVNNYVHHTLYFGSLSLHAPCSRAYMTFLKWFALRVAHGHAQDLIGRDLNYIV